MSAAVHDITIEQGVDSPLLFAWKNPDGTPINLTGYTARMQIRAKFTSDTALASMTTENGAIVLGGAAGTITVTVPAAAMQGVKFRDGDLVWVDERQVLNAGVYDLEMVSAGGQVTRLLQGVAYLSPEVTR